MGTWINMILPKIELQLFNNRHIIITIIKNKKLIIKINKWFNYSYPFAAMKHHYQNNNHNVFILYETTLWMPQYI